MTDQLPSKVAIPGPKQPPRIHGEGCICGDYTLSHCPVKNRKPPQREPVPSKDQVSQRAAADLAELRPCYSIEGLTAFIAKHFPAMELRERASGSPSKERATPRTDKAKFTTHSTRHERYIEAVVVEFARELERELAEARNLIESEWFQRVTYKQQARKAREENERLRATLTGISTCSTCEMCRGAATGALGEQS